MAVHGLQLGEAGRGLHGGGLRLRVRATCLRTRASSHRFLIPLVETGVDLGVDEEMPRVRAVFEAKVKWNLEEVEGPFKEVWCENYGSAVDNMEDIRW